MDFLSNLIKRPNSISLPEPNLVAEADAKNPEREVDPDSSSSSSKTVISSRNLSPSPNSLITLAMNRCSIDTDLENLFDSAAQELNSLEQQHNNLIEHEDAVPVLCPEPSDNPSCARETIKQLLNEINFNLDQVTAREMEHLQAMSLEVCVERMCMGKYWVVHWEHYSCSTLSTQVCGPVFVENDWSM